VVAARGFAYDVVAAARGSNAAAQATATRSAALRAEPWAGSNMEPLTVIRPSPVETFGGIGDE
jgi:hypothetical protein